MKVIEWYRATNATINEMRTRKATQADYDRLKADNREYLDRIEKGYGNEKGFGKTWRDNLENLMQPRAPRAG